MSFGSILNLVTRVLKVVELFIAEHFMVGSDTCFNVCLAIYVDFVLLKSLFNFFAFDFNLVAHCILFIVMDFRRIVIVFDHVSDFHQMVRCQIVFITFGCIFGCIGGVECIACIA